VVWQVSDQWDCSTKPVSDSPPTLKRVFTSYQRDNIHHGFKPRKIPLSSCNVGYRNISYRSEGKNCCMYRSLRTVDEIMNWTAGTSCVVCLLWRIICFAGNMSRKTLLSSRNDRYRKNSTQSGGKNSYNYRSPRSVDEILAWKAGIMFFLVIFKNISCIILGNGACG